MWLLPKSSHLYIALILFVTETSVATGDDLSQQEQQYQRRRRQKSYNNPRLLPNHRYKNVVVPQECREYIVTEFPILQNYLIEGNGTEPGGSVWKICEHLKDYGLHFPVFFARYLAYAIRPKTVLHFGCGLGTIADFLSRYIPGGTRVVCIESDPMLGDFFSLSNAIAIGNTTSNESPYLRKYPSRPMQLDFDIFSPNHEACTQAFSQSKDKFELVISLQIAEHLPPELLEDYMDWLVSVTGKYLIFSAAGPSQLADGQFEGSMKAPTWWVRQFHSRGMVTLPGITKALRQTAQPERPYDLFKNTLVFGASKLVPDDTSPPPAIADCRYYHAAECPRGKIGIERWLDSLELRNQRRAWAEGNWQALWPEVDILVRRLREGELKC